MPVPELPPVILPDSCNYIGVFLTLECTLGCSYCINRFGEPAAARTLLSGEEWVRGLNRIAPRSGLPLSLQGGEPTQHPDFCRIVSGIHPATQVDLLTNLECDIHEFMKAIPPDRLRRDAPYASIRVSYHPEVMAIEPLADRVLLLLERGYHIGIWGVLHPRWQDAVLSAREQCRQRGIDFRTKEFLGDYGGSFHGSLRYPGACDRGAPRPVDCRTSELIIGPDGHIYRCHGDLYGGRPAVGHLLDPGFRMDDRFRPCSWFGHCNPCDVKIKTNRYQEFGHTSVSIRGL